MTTISEILNEVQSSEAKPATPAEPAPTTPPTEEPKPNTPPVEEPAPATPPATPPTAEEPEDKINLVDVPDDKLQETAERLIEIPEAERTEDQINFLKEHTTAYDEEDDKPVEGDEEVKTFWKEVVEESGVQVDEDFEFGNDKDSIINYTKQVTKSTQAQVENFIKTKYPRSYAAMLAEEAGQDPSIIFSNNDENGLTNINLDDAQFEGQENAAELQVAKAETALFDLLLYKGVLKDDADMIINAAKDKGNVLERAKAELASFKEKHALKVEEENKKNQAIINNRKEKLNEFGSRIKDTIKTGSLGNFRIKEGDRDNFFNYLAEKVVQNEDDFYITSKIDKDNFTQLLQAEYLSFKGGDLDKIITRKTKSKIVMKMRTAEDKARKASENKDRTNTYQPIGSIV